MRIRVLAAILAFGTLIGCDQVLLGYGVREWVGTFEHEGQVYRIARAYEQHIEGQDAFEAQNNYWYILVAPGVPQSRAIDAFEVVDSCHEADGLNACTDQFRETLIRRALQRQQLTAQTDEDMGY